MRTSTEPLPAEGIAQLRPGREFRMSDRGFVEHDTVRIRDVVAPRSESLSTEEISRINQEWPGGVDTVELPFSSLRLTQDSAFTGRARDHEARDLQTAVRAVELPDGEIVVVSGHDQIAGRWSAGEKTVRVALLR